VCVCVIIQGSGLALLIYNNGRDHYKASDVVMTRGGWVGFTCCTAISGRVDIHTVYTYIIHTCMYVCVHAFTRKQADE